ncbi:MAG: hypothetical protein RL026_567 [Pseudomonadota bacterium]
MAPLLTQNLVQEMRTASRHADADLCCSLDLGRSQTTVHCLHGGSGFGWQGQAYPLPHPCRERTVYHWTGKTFEPVARFGSALYKLVPTEHGPPTFEIDGIKMLPSAQVSPWDDAARKVALVQPRGKRLLDCCGGLGYFAAQALAAGAAHLTSFERSAEVLWLRSVNPWSPAVSPALDLHHADVAQALPTLPAASVDAVLHDPPRFSIAGELYSQAFYDGLARVLRPGGLLFHYTGTPNARSHGRDLQAEVMRRLAQAGFSARREGDGLLARRR